MNQLYREVKASERLPEKDGPYVVFLNNDPDHKPMIIPFSKKDSDKEQWKMMLNWIEPIESENVDCENIDKHKFTESEDVGEGEIVEPLCDDSTNVIVRSKSLQITEEQIEEMATVYVEAEHHIYRGKRKKSGDIFVDGFKKALSLIKGE